GGSIPFDFFKMPPGAQLVTSLNGGSIALMEVVELAALGRLKILVDRYPLSEAKQAYDDFEHGRLVGRAVLMPAASQGTAGGGKATDSSVLEELIPTR
ncbi:MAG TPA: zinc-binding dehydrogenase, partial [Gemmatimonadales bacterium]